ncbi:hypothetical protein BS329_36365 [Amycolatopsis coloradensis]|uniref:Uncharacterized protein n=1 Tax=Amycolatopsis coloradensis TaxID=76021 RepID=A0A1R0KG83_9PSEU|nr:hypothetical protein BS329_36365 [Amycolatopsis coloradensis]
MEGETVPGPPSPRLSLQPPKLVLIAVSAADIASISAIVKAHGPAFLRWAVTPFSSPMRACCSAVASWASASVAQFGQAFGQLPQLRGRRGGGRFVFVVVVSPEVDMAAVTYRCQTFGVRFA